MLIQKSKGGGLSSQFGGAGAVMGVRQTNSFLEKATWTLLGLLIVLSVASAFTMPKNATGAQIRTNVETQAPATELPAGQFETPAPAAPAAEAPAQEAPAAPAQGE